MDRDVANGIGAGGTPGKKWTRSGEDSTSFECSKDPAAIEFGNKPIK